MFCTWPGAVTTPRILSSKGVLLVHCGCFWAMAADRGDGPRSDRDAHPPRRAGNVGTCGGCTCTARDGSDRGAERYSVRVSRADRPLVLVSKDLIMKVKRLDAEPKVLDVNLQHWSHQSPQPTL